MMFISEMFFLPGPTLSSNGQRLDVFRVWGTFLILILPAFQCMVQKEKNGIDHRKKGSMVAVRASSLVLEITLMYIQPVVSTSCPFKRLNHLDQ